MSQTPDNQAEEQVDELKEERADQQKAAADAEDIATEDRPARAR